MTDWNKGITHRICEEVTKRFPEAKHIAISGFIFLRWMIPAISVKPEQNGLIAKAMATPKASRVFLLIGKVLQVITSTSAVSFLLRLNVRCTSLFYLSVFFVSTCSLPLFFPLIHCLDAG
jgi:hypothetical protein